MEIVFSDLAFRVVPGIVMAPRAATEALVAAATARIGSAPLRVADVGTGSGAIAVAIASRASLAQVWATDVSASAVAAARANAHRHGVSDRVHVLQGNLLEPIPGPIDLVVANLPYLPESARRAEYEGEPREAIYAPGDGLLHYRRCSATPDGSSARAARS